MSQATSVLDNIYSEVIPRRLYFGGFPRSRHFHQWKDRIESWNVRPETIIMIDLTTSDEKHRFRLHPYADLYARQDAPDTHGLSITYFNYPIPDNTAPLDVSEYLTFLLWIKATLLSTTAPIIIHCKGGHSRSAMVVVGLLCLLYGYSIVDSIDRVTQLHHTRPGLHYKYFLQLCPVSPAQQEFLLRLPSSLMWSSILEKHNLTEHSAKSFISPQQCLLVT